MRKKILCVLILSLLIIAGRSYADEDSFMRETQKISKDKDQLCFVWWVPDEFWKLSSADNPKITKAQTDELTKVFSPYLIIIAMKAKVGVLGGMSYEPDAELRGSIQVKDKSGNLYHPIYTQELSPDLKNAIKMLQPVIAGMLGPMGENMQFYVFPATDKKKLKIADAKKEGSFSVLIDEKEFKWRLPLGSLLPEKTCPTCGDKLSGAFKFCPWDGVRL